MLRIYILSAPFLALSLSCCGSPYRTFNLQEVTTQQNVSLWNPDPIVTLSANDILDCTTKCTNIYPNCTAVSFDDVSYQCSLGHCAIPWSSVQPSSSHIYQTKQANCTDHPGFNMKPYGNTSACLWFSTTIANFTDAKKSCFQKGAIMATFKTWEKFQMLKDVGKIVYIGLDDIDTEGVFRWHDDGSVLDEVYEKQIFLPREPNNYNNEDCVVTTSNTTILLKDYPCTYWTYYICEIICLT